MKTSYIRTNCIAQNFTGRLSANRRVTGMLVTTSVLMLSALQANAATYYINKNGANWRSGTSETDAWLTLSKAADTIQPGDTVIVDAGTYDEPQLWLNENGSPTQWTTWKAKAGTRPIIRAAGTQAVIYVNGSYVNIEGFEVTTLPSANSDCGGIGVTGEKKWGANTQGHHVNIRNNIVHDVPGGGIGGVESDYVVIENNTTYKCAYWSGYQTSGISLYEQRAFDTASGFHSIIRNNRSYLNENKVPDGNNQVTDGNGIIVDDFEWSQKAGNPPYRQATLVENNVCYNNGGRGINIYFSDNVTVRNNTTYNNQFTPEVFGDGELRIWESENVTAVNNILYSRTGAKAFVIQATNAYVNNNVYFNGSVYRNNHYGTFGAQNYNADPQFVNTATNDFHIKSTSPARNAGDNSNRAAVDFEGQNRPNETTVDIGADEFYGSSQGSNLVTNAGFEAEQFNTQTPSGWSEWSSSGGVNSSYTEGGGAHTGNYHGTHWNNVSYNMYTSQTKTSLQNGLYTLKAWVKSNGTQWQCWLEAKDYGGTTKSTNIPNNWTWNQVVVSDINVTNGQCTIGFWSSGPANACLYFDDVEFYKQ